MADLSFYISPLSEAIREEGRVQGRLQGRAETILFILDERCIDVMDATREKVSTCGDPELLRRWLRRAVLATTAEEIFGDGEPAAR
ncbi:hypothetical protein ACFWMX_19455 [Streptomyces sp. NPDC058378]|uniref:hypothetical protein n=1 Tax=unclassified Streptomyces TaxID=2593676 RepID=UPI0036630459